MSASENVFETEIHDGVLVVLPVSDQIGFRMGPLQDRTDQITRMIEQGEVRSVVVDATNLAFLGSAVISAFIQIWEAAVEHGGGFVTCNLSDDALQSLIVTRLDTRWPTYDSREEALAAVS
jgi:anti-anti-sigma factor